VHETRCILPHGCSLNAADALRKLNPRLCIAEPLHATIAICSVVHATPR